MRECACSVPEPKINNPKVCVKCAASIDTAWASNDRTLDAFLNRLQETIPDRSPAWETFRLHVEARERAGRPIFRQSFLGKQNLKEAREEAADLALYACLHSLQRLREGADQNMDLVLSMAYHAYKSYEASVILHSKEAGVPVPPAPDTRA